jgi:hypothetical protein
LSEFDSKLRPNLINKIQVIKWKTKCDYNPDSGFELRATDLDRFVVDKKE